MCLTWKGFLVSERWLIHKGGAVLGPYEAREVRDALRSGAIDPFDKVSREGSSVRRDLVDVDELFIPSGAVAEPPGMATTELPAPTLSERESEATVATRRLDGAAAVDPDEDDPDRRRAPPAARRRQPRNFHIINAQGRVLGPVSAAEILALYYKGILDKRVRVQRQGAPQEVPVARFVTAYGAASSRRAPGQAHHPSMPRSRRLSAMGPKRQARLAPARSQQFSPLATAVLGLALILAGASVYLVLASHVLRHAPRRATVLPRDGVRAPLPPLEFPPISPLPPPSPGEWPTPRPTSASTAVPSRGGSTLPRPSGAPAHRGGGPLSTRERPPIARREPLPRPQPAAKSPSKPLAIPRPNVYQAPRTVPPASFKTPLAMAPPPSARPATASPAAAVAAAGGMTNGQSLQHYGPMTFSKSDLDSCSGSCNIPFRGSGGQVLRVVFFKEAWAGALAAKAGGVYVSGIVRTVAGGPPKLILANAQ